MTETMANNSNDERDQWEAINAQREYAHQIALAAARIEQSVKDHITNQALHPPRPCNDFRALEEKVKSIDKRWWAAVGGVVVTLLAWLGAMVGALWHTLK